MRVGIPSYKRVDRFDTLKALHDLGYGKNEIIVSTQTAEEYESYSKAHGSVATVIYREGTNDSINRNTLLNYFNEGENIVVMDDDIKEFHRLVITKGKNTLAKIGSRQEFEGILLKQFSFCEKYRSPMFAWYTVDNAFFMSKTAHIRSILDGTILGIKNSYNIRFNEINDLKGDYELSCRLIESGYNAVRFNGYSAKAGSKTPGGCEDARKAGHNSIRCRALLERYPELLTAHPTRKGEVKFIGRTKKVAYQ